MRWLDGSDIDVKQFTGETLCDKIGMEMYKYDDENRLQCDDFIQNAMFIIDFDSVINMEGFPTPYYGYFSEEYYAKIIWAFQAIGDVKDAEILIKAGEEDLHFQQLRDQKKGTEEWDCIYDEFSEKLDALEQGLYLNTDFDMWSLLYTYLDEHIKK